MQSVDDSDLADRAIAGDGDAFAALVKPHLPKLLELARFITGSRTESEDVVQDALAKAIKALPRYDTSRPVEPWLCAIVANTARNHKRASFRRLLRDDRSVQFQPHQSSDVPSEAALVADDRERLVRSLAVLGDTDKTVLAFRFLLDFSEQETANALGCRVGTVKSRTSRALGRLRTVMADSNASQMDDSTVAEGGLR
jgi:RNA polymerase sigma factor (sigma-70 family)